MPATTRPPLLRIVVTSTIALAISAVAIFAGIWQYGRHETRADARAAYDAAVDAPAAPLAELVAPGSPTLPDDAEWRTVTATGAFEPESLTILRGRPVDGTPAWQFLAWLDTDAGQSLLVNLGWIPQPGPTEDPPMPALDDRTVTVTAVLRAWEDDDGRTGADSITRITPAQLPAPAAEPVPGYGMLREICDEDGCADTPVGAPVPLPELTHGPHLSYAWQWWVFAVMAPVGGFLLLRRDARLEAEGGARPAPPRPSRRRRQRVPTDEEIEDAL